MSDSLYASLFCLFRNLYNRTLCCSCFWILKMNSSDGNKKQPVKKTKNSYSLLIKGFTDAEKTKAPKKPNPVQRSNTPEINSSVSMSSNNNDDYPNNSSISNEKIIDIQDPDIPDRSFGDYYCKLCDSHMNSDNMWEAHITGKRHIKNVKKGDTESKYDDLPDVESTVKYEMRNVKDPVVGLDYIHEIRRKEPNVPPTYNCFLCHASIATVPLVTEHVISLKHRLNYVRENNPEEYELLQATNLKKAQMEPLVLDAARKLEVKFGRGTVRVKQEKKKDPVYTYSAKKSFNMNDESFNDAYQKPSFDKNLREDPKSSSVWKSVSTESNFGRRERSRSPRNFSDRFRSPPRSRPISRSRSRSPRDFRERKRRYSEERSLDDYRRSFPKRSISPPEKRSPKYDYDSFRSSVEYHPHLSGKTDFHEKQDYISPRQPSTSFMTQGSYISSNERPAVDHLSQPRNPVSDEPRSFDDVFKYIFFLSSEERYKFCYHILKSVPEVKNIQEMLWLTKLISESQKKLKNGLTEEIVSALLNYQKSDSSSNIIPGLGDVMASSAKSLNIASSNSAKFVTNTANFLSDLFKNGNLTSQDKPSFPYPLSTPYAPAMSSQSSTLANTYQVPPTNYQAAPANSYQGTSTGSYPNQASYQPPNENVPFASGSMQNFQRDMPGINPADKNTAQGSIYNYSHFSSTATSSSMPGINPADKNPAQGSIYNYSHSHYSSASSPSKNFHRKY